MRCLRFVCHSVSSCIVAPYQQFVQTNMKHRSYQLPLLKLLKLLQLLELLELLELLKLLELLELLELLKRLRSTSVFA